MDCSKAAKPKLIYFDGKGRAEVARLLLAQAGVEFEDHRVNFDEWQEMKKKLNLPYGMPALEINGKRYCQSLAITQYIARKYDLYGDNPEQAIIIDIIGQCLHDIASKLPMFEKDEEKKKAKLDELFTDVYPALFDYVESLVPKTGYVVGGKVTLVDIGLFRMHEVMEEFRKGFMGKYPNISNVAQKVGALPKIAAYMKARPKTAF